MNEIIAHGIPRLPIVLARHGTDSGEIQLQQRLLPNQSEVFEIISDGVFLMSSEFHAGELALAQQALVDVEEAAVPLPDSKGRTRHNYLYCGTRNQGVR